MGNAFRARDKQRGGPWYSKLWSALAEAWPREVAKRLLQGLVLVVFSLLVYLLQLNVPPRGATPWNLYLPQLLKLNWKPILKILFSLGVLAFLFFFFRRLIEAYKRIKTEATMKRDVGILNFFPVAKYGQGGVVDPDPEMQRRAEEQIVTVVRGSIDIDVILVSGYRVVGTIASPGFLIQAIKDGRDRRYRFLLVDPDWAGSSLKDRAERISKTPQKYAEGIREVLEHLALLKLTVHIPLKIWLFKEIPTFQMFKTNEEIWVQSAVAFRSEDSPLCGFVKSPYSLYWALERFWERMWQSWGGDERELDLEPYFPKPHKG